MKASKLRKTRRIGSRGNGRSISKVGAIRNSILRTVDKVPRSLKTIIT